MKKSVIVCGPQGCGKTRNKEAIANALGLSTIVDDWVPGMDIHAHNTLMLCNHQYPKLDGYIVISYEAAMMADGFAKEAVR